VVVLLATVGSMDVKALTNAASSGLAAAAQPEKAGPMAAYLKTEMPFYGVQKAGRTPVMRHLRQQFPPLDRDDYEEAVLGLWRLEHREEKYLAIDYARAFDEFVVFGSLPLYTRMITEGAWWDLVDGIASRLVGRVLLEDRNKTEPVIRSWIRSDDMWLQRTSIICQLNHKADTDTSLLSEACTVNLADTEFFIRKAIGWSLREYAKTNLDWVRAYVADHRAELSGLSYREATKHL
jgi:3-methyladenine DNA glycosylase AlkD